RLGYSTVRHQCALDFRSSQSMAANIDYIVDTAHYPEITIRITPRAVPRKVDPFDLRPVLLFVAFVVTPNSSQHRRPGPFDDQITALIRAHRPAVASHHIGLDPGERLRARTGLRRRRSRNRRDHDRAGFRLPPRIDDRASLFSDHFAIPHPRLGVDRFANRAEQTQARQVVLQRPLLAPFYERANR